MLDHGLFFDIVNPTSARLAQCGRVLMWAEPINMKETVMTTIKANVMNDKTVVRALSCEVKIPTSLADASKMWGDDVALNLLVDAATIAAQSTMRGLGNPGRKAGRLDDKAIQEKMAAWKPGARNVERDPVKKASNIVAKLSDETRAALLKALQEEKPTLIKKRA